MLVRGEGEYTTGEKRKNPDKDTPTLEKTAEKDIVDLSNRKSAQNTYTIKLTNTTDKEWKDVKVNGRVLYPRHLRGLEI